MVVVSIPAASDTHFWLVYPIDQATIKELFDNMETKLMDQLFTPTAKPKQKPDYHLEQIDGEMILYHLNEQALLYCNETASLIWHLSSGERSVREIVNLLSETYPESVKTIQSDVEDTLAQFLDLGCIELA